MRIVTTCHKAGYDEYAYRLRENIDNLPPNAEVRWYVEGFKAPDHPRLTQVGIGKIPRLTALREKYAYYRPPSYLYDVARFANKVYAAYDALYDYDGIGVWMDADCIPYAAIPEGWIETQLATDYMAVFKRRGMYTETGFWIVNCAHAEHKAFFDTWLEWYESAAFKGLANWTDCETLDATIRKFERAGKVTVGSLSGGHEDKQHPMAYAPISAFCDHTKGPRKQAGFSPENRNRMTDEPYQLNDCK
jgi:hypothetical protein